MYPITYYFMGCYIRDYPLKWKQSTKLLAILAITATGMYNIYRSYSVPFISGDWTEQRSILYAVPGYFIFSFFQDMDFSRMPPWLCKSFQKFSNISLAAFLLSWIPEQYIYPIIVSLEPIVPQQLRYFPVAVPFVLITSLLMAALVDWVCGFLCRGLLAAGGRIAAKLETKK